MLETYTYVEGASLTALLLEVRSAFVSALPVDECEGYSVPNSVRALALEAFDGQPPTERSRIILDLFEANGSLRLPQTSDNLFAHAHAPSDFISDLVCEVVSQVLRRDPSIQAEDELRLALAGE